MKARENPTDDVQGLVIMVFSDHIVGVVQDTVITRPKI